MNYLCDETNEDLIALLQQENIEKNDQLENYPFGKDFVGYEWYEPHETEKDKYRGKLLIVRNNKEKVNHDIFSNDSVTLRGITFEENSDIKTVNALIENNSENFVFNMYDITEEGLKLKESIPIEGNQI